MSEDLKTCPLCGGGSFEFEQVAGDTFRCEHSKFWCNNPKCNAYVEFNALTKGEAIRRLNTRTPDTIPRAWWEAVRAAIQDCAFPKDGHITQRITRAEVLAVVELMDSLESRGKRDER